jgi:hypothetical protein
MAWNGCHAQAHTSCGGHANDLLVSEPRPKARIPDRTAVRSDGKPPRIECNTCSDWAKTGFYRDWIR